MIIIIIIIIIVTISRKRMIKIMIIRIKIIIRMIIRIKIKRINEIEPGWLIALLVKRSHLSTVELLALYARQLKINLRSNVFKTRVEIGDQHHGSVKCKY
jgi:hypothetical protein